MAVFKSLESPLIPLFSSSPHQSSSHPVDLQLLHPGPSHHHLSPVRLHNPTGPSASTPDHTIHCALSGLSLFHSLKDTRAYVSPPTAMQQCGQGAGLTADYVLSLEHHCTSSEKWTLPCFCMTPWDENTKSNLVWDHPLLKKKKKRGEKLLSRKTDFSECLFSGGISADRAAQLCTSQHAWLHFLPCTIPG